MKGTVRRKKETTKGGKNLTNGRAMLAPTEQRGITLIALIITIIVMLILVAVTVTTVVNSGLFGKAGEATQKWANAQEQENSLGDGTYVSDMVNQYTNGIKNPGETTTPESEGNPLKVGDYVDYTPDAASSYSLLSAYSGDTSDRTIPQDSLKWRVLSINADGTVDIVSETPTTKTVYFNGALGYNNGVYFLNDICKTQYSNSTLGTTARSINLEYIESKMNTTGISARNAYNNGNKTYGETQTYTGSNAYTPDIYTKVAQTTEGETSNYYTSPTTNTYTQQSSLTVKNTYYEFDTTPSSYFDNSTFHELVFGSSWGFWLATRSTECDTSYSKFGLRCKSGNARLSAYCFYRSYDDDAMIAGYRLRPIVSLGSDIQISETGGTEDAPRTLSKI